MRWIERPKRIPPVMIQLIRIWHLGHREPCSALELPLEHPETPSHARVRHALCCLPVGTWVMWAQCPPFRVEGDATFYTTFQSLRHAFCPSTLCVLTGGWKSTRFEGSLETSRTSEHAAPEFQETLMHRTSHGQPAVRDLVARPTASARPSHELGCYKHRHFLRLLARSAAASAFFWNEIRVMLGSPTYGQVYVAKSLILHCQFSHAQLKPITGMAHCLGSIRRERFRSCKAVLNDRIPHCLLFDSEERVQLEVRSCCAAFCFVYSVRRLWWMNAKYLSYG